MQRPCSAAVVLLRYSKNEKPARQSQSYCERIHFLEAAFTFFVQMYMFLKEIVDIEIGARFYRWPCMWMGLINSNKACLKLGLESQVPSQGSLPSTRRRHQVEPSVRSQLGPLYSRWLPLALDTAFCLPFIGIIVGGTC